MTELSSAPGASSEGAQPVPYRLAVDLEYFPGHRALLASGEYANLGTAQAVSAFQADAYIDLRDFLNYFLIQRALSPQYGTYAARLAHIDQTVTWLENAISVDGTVKTLEGSGRLQEEVGEAVSLSVANRLFDLTEADWRVIPIQRGAGAAATFDFELAWDGVSLGGHRIQIEAKGSFVQDNGAANQANIRAQAKKISDKKRKLRAAGEDAGGGPVVVRYGMIVAIDPTNNAKCWLLDPPSIAGEHGNPLDHKAANRIEFAASILDLLAPKSKLPLELKRRAQDWRDGVVGADEGALVSARHHSFAAGYYVEDFFTRGKVSLRSLDTIGQFFVNSEGRAFFIGVRAEFVRTIINQNRQQIVEARFRSETKRDRVRVRARRLGTGLRRDLGVKQFDFYASSSGVVIGLPA